MATPSEPSTTLIKETNDTLHTGPNNTRAIRYLDTATAYDLWSSVYDSDGNFLQALDTIQMSSLLPSAMSILTSDIQSGSVSPTTKIKAVDLGCGTGRNTLGLLDFPQISEVVAVDLSPKMLEVARRRCLEKVKETTTTTDTATATDTLSSPTKVNLTFNTYDMTASTAPPEHLTSPPANLIISTLVLEHIPLSIFFQTVNQILSPSGLLILTNMHSSMGEISQAGFIDPKTGDKIRPVSYVHTVQETVEEAERWGFEVVPGSKVEELKMGEELVGVLGRRSEKWVGIDVWFGGIWRRKREE